MLHLPLRIRPFARRAIAMAAGFSLALTCGAFRINQAVADEVPAATGGEANRSAEDFFETHVRPLLIDHCYDCHSLDSGESSGQLRLDDAVASQRGGTRGPAVVPGDVEASLLVRAVEYADADLQMPPDGKLEAEQIEILRRWVESGAYDPRQPADGDAASMETPSEAVDPKNHWAFQLPQPSPPPVSVHADSRDILDAVVAERLAEHSMVPAVATDRRTLIRRLSYDLTGLPPSAQAIEAFATSDAPDAYERLVDTMLASPDFGERWARHWMDVARYADTVGYALGGQDRRLHGSERYRDWLIQNYNADLPYDAMIRYQIAADAFDPDGSQGHLDAMGFLTVGRKYLSHHDILDDQIDVVTRGLLGLTVACARCHDHKFDPIPTTDYYSMFGIFDSSRRDGDANSPWPLRVVDKENPHDAFVLVRGQPGNHGPRAERRFVDVLSDEDDPAFTQGSGRKELAEHIATDTNPLTARVYVNRIWAHLVGRPLVDSPSDFGVRTEPPRHPEVLDDLAYGFMANEWSTKWLVRRIVMTHIYQQSAVATESQVSADPENLWLGRGNRRRLDFEAMRDSVLVVSGRLETSFGGPPVSILEHPTPPRRTVYAFIDRQELPGVFRVFDLASPDAHTPQRYFTTVPQQALFLMNSPFARRAAGDVVRELTAGTAAPEPSDAAVTRAIYRRILRREPTGEELSMAARFLSTAAAPTVPVIDPRYAWTYGAARIADNGVVEEFRPFPHFQDGRYQASGEFPDPVWAHSLITARGGHPGNGNDWAVVRRIKADFSGQVIMEGFVEHPEKQGNGVRATIVARGNTVWSKPVHGTRQSIDGVAFDIQQGETIDIIVDSNGAASFDSFECAVNARVTDPQGNVVVYRSRKDFSGPLPAAAQHQTLDRRQQLAQVLMMSNEFMFID